MHVFVHTQIKNPRIATRVFSLTLVLLLINLSIRTCKLRQIGRAHTSRYFLKYPHLNM